MWGAWCKTLVGGFSLGEWEPLCPRPTLPEAACNTAGGLGGAVSPPAGSGRERILVIMYIKFASCGKKNPLWGAPNCEGLGAAAPFAPLLIRHCSNRRPNIIILFIDKCPPNHRQVLPPIETTREVSRTSVRFCVMVIGNGDGNI